MIYLKAIRNNIKKSIMITPKNIITISLAFVSLSFTASAQDLNSMSGGSVKQKAPPPSDCTPKLKEPGAWDLSSALGFNFTSGNIDSRLLTASFNAEREIESDIYKFNVTGAEGEQNDETTQRFIRSTARYNRLITERTYFGMGGSFLKDDIAKVDYRGVINPGIGYFLVKSDEVELSFEGGPAYVWQKLTDKEDFLAARAANDFSWKLSETAKIFQTAEFLLNTEKTDEYIMVGTAGLEAALMSSLALVTSLQDRFNSLPADNRQKNDVMITTALKVSF